jgi:hypothetical protein
MTNSMKALDAIQAVSDAINRIYDVQTTVEYPGFVNIPERFISDDTDGSDNAWAVGPDVDGAWTGQLMTPDGYVVRDMTFVVVPRSTEPDDIASAVYCHGIGDLYLGGGCSDHDCPRKR